MNVLSIIIYLMDGIQLIVLIMVIISVLLIRKCMERRGLRDAIKAQMELKKREYAQQHGLNLYKSNNGKPFMFETSNDRHSA